MAVIRTCDLCNEEAERMKKDKVGVFNRDGRLKNIDICEGCYNLLVDNRMKAKKQADLKTLDYIDLKKRAYL